MTGVRAGLRVYQDEDVDVLLGNLLTFHGFDCRTSFQEGHLGWSDEAHLLHASGDSRILITHNRKHFESLAVAWWKKQQEHAGIVLAVRRADTLPAFAAPTARLGVVRSSRLAEQRFCTLEPVSKKLSNLPQSAGTLWTNANQKVPIPPFGKPNPNTCHNISPNKIPNNVCLKQVFNFVLRAHHRFFMHTIGKTSLSRFKRRSARLVDASVHVCKRRMGACTRAHNGSAAWRPVTMTALLVHLFAFELAQLDSVPPTPPSGKLIDARGLRPASRSSCVTRHGCGAGGPIDLA